MQFHKNEYIYLETSLWGKKKDYNEISNNSLMDQCKTYSWK